MRRDAAGSSGLSAEPYLLVLPALILVLAFWGYPAVYALVLSFTDSTLSTHAGNYVGLGNYVALFDDPVFGVSVRNTAVLLGASVVLEVSVGMGAAFLLLGAGRRQRACLVTLLLVPWLFSDLVSALTWRWVFHEPCGLLNAVLSVVGVEGPAWLGRPWSALTAILTASLWQGAGMSALVLFAALRTVPTDLLELSITEGVTGWQRFRHVTLPMIRGVLILDALLVAVKSLGTFTLVFALTGGGPGQSTEVLATYAYRLLFVQYESGSASAVGIFLAALFLVPVFLVYLVRKSEERRGGGRTA